MSHQSNHQTLVERFRRARSDPSLAVLEGFHPLKHAVRFGAELIEAYCLNLDDLAEMGGSYAPDIAEKLIQGVETLPDGFFQQLAPVPPPTGVIAIARRPQVTPSGILGSADPGPVLFLENPRNLLNIGAAVRVAAAAGGAGLITTGPQDPWNPAALIASTGLHYAVPVARADSLPASKRPLVVFDPVGEPLRPGLFAADSVLAFGSERGGISSALLARAERCVSIPMRAGVSSLNLATTVAVVLYTLELGQ